MFADPAGGIGRGLVKLRSSSQSLKDRLSKLTMPAILPLEERRRKSRNVVFAALLTLVFIWTVKLAFPQTTIINAFPSHIDATTEVVTSTVSQPPAPQQTVEGSKWQSPTLGDTPATHHVQNGTVTSKAAVIIETRFRTNLVPLILHFSSVLGTSWPIIIYTSPESIGQFSTSAALARYIKAGIIHLRLLPQTVLFTNSDSVNQFMTQSWLWESLAPAEHILIFQSDSMLCANAARSVDDFFAYDLVGAPIRKGLGKGYNGGLSLRKRSTILRVLEGWDWETTKTDGDRFEDQWYYNRFVSPPFSLPIPKIQY